MKLWNKGYTTDNIVEKFTIGKDRILDLKLVKNDVACSNAHARMLHKIGILTDEELKDILSGLAAIQQSIDDRTFIIEDD